MLEFAQALGVPQDRWPPCLREPVTPPMQPPLAGNLPAPLTPLIGREANIERLAALIHGGARLITLTGAPGAGKTRLATAVAVAVMPEFDHGAYFVSLAAACDADQVLSDIARTLHVHEPGNRPLQSALRGFLKPRRMLLVLDNFEQVAEAGPAVVALLEGAPRLHVIVTSRRLLHVRGEHEIVVAPLALPSSPGLPVEALEQTASVALFTTLLRARRPDFALSPVTAPAVAEICILLDGLPLAIELAAARAGVLSPVDILGQLRRSRLAGCPPARPTCPRATVTCDRLSRGATRC